MSVPNEGTGTPTTSSTSPESLQSSTPSQDVENEEVTDQARNNSQSREHQVRPTRNHAGQLDGETAENVPDECSGAVPETSPVCHHETDCCPNTSDHSPHHTPPTSPVDSGNDDTAQGDQEPTTQALGPFYLTFQDLEGKWPDPTFFLSS